MANLPDIISVEAVEMDDRIRKDYGDINDLITSIREFGVIQPVVLSPSEDGTKFRLVAGGRRMTAIKRGKLFAELRHGREFVWRDETFDGDISNKLRLQGMELEENLKRKDLAWGEIVLGKQRLLEIMQEIHGKAEVGGRTRAERATGVSQGFGVRKLAAMLGESPAATSRDLQLASVVKVIPSLKTESSKDSAMKKAVQIIAKVTGKTFASAVPQNVKPIEYRIIVTCTDEKHQSEVFKELTARGLKCQLLIV